jgi:hypothetical protein
MTEMMEISRFMWCILIMVYFVLCVAHERPYGTIKWWAWPGVIVLFMVTIGGALCVVGFVLYALAYPLIQWLTPIVLPLITPQ